MDDEALILTPELAAALLNDAIGGQAVDEDKIIAFTEAIRAGRWRAGSPLSLYADGALRDGHHRCWAVVRAGRSIEVHPDTVGWLDDRY
jgi:hypothetical protein